MSIVTSFFVPNRILWPNWENFISGGEDGLADPTFPTVDLTIPTQYGIQTLADYLGLPTGNQITDVSALPFAAYQKIYQDYYRDENLITKTDVTLSDGTQSASDIIELSSMKKRAWQHDYFTSALPWTQRGPEATIPLGTTAPISYVSSFKNQLRKQDGTPVNALSIDEFTTEADGDVYADIPTASYINLSLIHI